MAPLIVFTIGHSTRSIDEFIRLLEAHEVRRVIDVRTIPRSRHNPQFNRDTLPSALRRARIHYRHMPGLGGLRHARRDSINGGWRNESFRGYADYMQTATFRRHLDRCIDLAKSERVVLMCGEAVPWRCHRSLIADALLVRGIAAGEITSAVRVRPHVLTPWARANGTELTYPGAAECADTHEGVVLMRVRKSTNTGGVTRGTAPVIRATGSSQEGRSRKQAADRTALPRSLPRPVKLTRDRSHAVPPPAHVRVLGGHIQDDDRERIGRKLGMKLGKFAASIERITVRLSDANGPKGGRDQVCQIKVVISGLPSVVVEERDATFPRAVDRAISSTALAVRRSLQRRRLKPLHHRAAKPSRT